MANQALFAQFQKCLRYKQAPSWQKPLLNPVRFARNQWRYRKSITNRGELSEVSVFHHRPFTIVNGETVSEHLAAYGVYEEGLTEGFLRLIQPGQVVVDIGMHLGYYATLFARLVSESGAVHAFEPTPSTREIASRNLGQFRQVAVHPFAVWNCAQQITFNDFGTAWMAFNSFTDARMENGPPAPRQYAVETVTLDAFRQRLQRKIDVVKIDAESAEEQILAGAEGLLRSDQPLVTIEVGDLGDSRSSRHLIEVLRGQGYHPWELAGHKFVRHHAKESYEYGNLIFATASLDLGRR